MRFSFPKPKYFFLMFFIRRMTSIRVSFHRYRLLTSLYYLRDFVRIENNIYEFFSFISDAKDHFTLVCYSELRTQAGIECT